MQRRTAAGLALWFILSGGLARAQSAVDGFNPGANSHIIAVATQADGRILVGGFFTTIGGGGTGTTPRNRIARLNVDGTVDTTFDPGASWFVRKIVVQPDGKILLGGDFEALGGGSGRLTPRSYIGRLNADGTVDASFNPGADKPVRDVVLQPDGKIVVVGDFTTLGGGGTGTTARLGIGRLNADGTLDAGFDPGIANPSGIPQVYAAARQSDGKIVVGGWFSGLGGGTGTTARQAIGRLNADGSLDTLFNPGISSTCCVFDLAVQPDGKILLGGTFTGLGGGTGTIPRQHIGRLNPDGTVDPGFDPGVAGSWVRVVTVQPDGRILVGGGFTGLGGGTGATPRSNIGRLTLDGTVDMPFNPGANGEIWSLSVQADGSLLVGGTDLSMLGGGGTGTTPRNSIGRLYPDGWVDADLNPNANSGMSSSAVNALVTQPDGTIVVGGNFSNLGGNFGARNAGRLTAIGVIALSYVPNGPVNTLALQPDGLLIVGGMFTSVYGYGCECVVFRSNLARLQAGGELDAAFNPGTDGPVNAVALQADGKIVVGGSFSILGLQEELNLGRLNADGSVDTSFALWTNGAVHAIAVQPDGRILVGGDFTTIYDDNNSVMLTRNRIARLNADGSIDPAFNPNAEGSVYALALQADGKILLGGAFASVGGFPHVRIARLNADGTHDASFTADANSDVLTLAVQADGKILAGGLLSSLGGAVRSRIGRLNADGAIDAGFNPGADLAVRAIAVQPDGKVLVGGDFTTLGGGGSGLTPRSRIGRLTATGAAIQNLRVTLGGSLLTWSRSGTAPEVSRVTFESSADDAVYTPLGEGTRVAGGWRLDGQSVPANQNRFIRARGYTSAGSVIESRRNTYVSVQPFTDVLTAGVSGVRALHVTELRTRIDALRMRFGGAAYPWIDPSLAAGAPIKRIHVVELRIALEQAYVLAGQTAPAFSDAIIVVGSTMIRLVHVKELRDAVMTLEES